MAATSRSNQRRAGAVLLWGVGVFILVQIGGSALLDYRWPEVRFSTAAYLFDVLHTRPHTPDVVGLGSSRIGLALNAAEVGTLMRRHCHDDHTLTVFNASIPSGDLITADFVMEHLITQGIRPGLAVVEISPETLNRYNQWMGYHITRQLRWDDLPDYLPDIFRAGTFRRLLTHRLFPLYIYRLNIYQACANQFVDARETEKNLFGYNLTSDQGGLDSQGLFGDIIEGMVARGEAASPGQSQAGLASLRKWVRTYRVGGTPIAALDRLLRRCQQHGIHVVLVGVPVTRDHRAHYTPAMNAAFLATMAQVARSYDCRFADFRDQVPDALFLDNHHLLPEGNRYFTHRLTREVLIPAWQSRRERLAGASAP